MKNFPKLLCLLALIFMISNAKAQNPTDAQMKAWNDYMTPGDAQKMLAKSEGDWKVETSMYMNPSQPPQKSRGTSHNEMIMGGRYLSTKFKGEMMAQPFEGMGTIGYDNGKKIFMSTWVDNLGTGIGYMEGKLSPDGKSIEFRGKMYDPMAGKDVMVRQVNTFIDDNRQKIQMYSTGNDKKENLTMEIFMSR